MVVAVRGQQEDQQVVVAAKVQQGGQQQAGVELQWMALGELGVGKSFQME